MSTLEAPRDFGSLIGEHKQGDTALWLFRDGLFVERKRKKFAGPFDVVRALYLDDTAAAPALRVTLPGRLSFRLDGADKNAKATLRSLVNQVTPILLQRAADEFARGETVDFGVVRMDHDTIAVRRGLGWKRLSLDRLSGWLVRDGWLFLDGDGAERFAEIRVRKIANHPALVALLRKRCATADLTQPANALRHAARGRHWFSSPRTALARRPETAAKLLGRWALYATAIAAGGAVGLYLNLDERAMQLVEQFRWLYQHTR